ncbi:Triose-phosphate Transporter [Lobosporangium transversale]|nr:Triose-phosphate Transporter [Lobosporangium transversale]
MSSHIHNLKVGDTLSVKGPISKYPLKVNQHKSIALIAGGSGLTPILQLIYSILHDKEDVTKINFIFANVTPDDIILKDVLDELVKTHPDQLKVTYVVSRPPAEGWIGETGRVNAEMIRRHVPEIGTEGNKVFVCGPPGMMNAISGPKNPDLTQGELIGALKDLGLTSEQVFKGPTVANHCLYTIYIFTSSTYAIHTPRTIMTHPLPSENDDGATAAAAVVETEIVPGPATGTGTGSGIALSGARARQANLRDPFDDESSFLTVDHSNHNNLEDEQESFIDPTADSYHAPKNPFADPEGYIMTTTTTTAVARKHKELATYDDDDSFDSQTDDNNDSDGSGSYDSDSEDDSDNDNGHDRITGGYHGSADVDDGLDDTQHLLLNSNNTRLGGMGMGMRVGETGTGTMIGLDLEPHGDCNPYGRRHSGSKLDYEDENNDYDTLPLSTMDVDSYRMKGGNKKKSSKNSSKRKQRVKREKQRGDQKANVNEGPVLGLGAIRTEQMAAIAKKQFRVQLAWNAFYVFAWYSTKIVPCAVASGLDIGLSNSSLKTITLAFYTMCKSSSLAFVLLFAFLFKLERPTWTLAGVITVICVGLFLMVMSEVDFVLIGFIQVMLASVLGGLRWSLTQMLLERSDTKSGSLANPISTIFFLSPIMGVCLFIVAGIFEGYGVIFGSVFFSAPLIALETMGLLLLGGLFAFMMVLAEFNLIARTSVVTLSVLGIVKEVMTILISALVFRDQLTLVNILGLFITLTGIGFYHFMKMREMKAKARRQAKEISDTELANAAKKRERKIAKKLLREQKKRGVVNIGVGAGLLNKDIMDLGKDDEDDLIIQSRPSKELPWNHGLISTQNPNRSSQDRLMHDEDAFILDDGENDARNGGHGIGNGK